jgi:hypothetical protein
VKTDRLKRSFPKPAEAKALAAVEDTSEAYKKSVEAELCAKHQFCAQDGLLVPPPTSIAAARLRDE